MHLHVQRTIETKSTKYTLKVTKCSSLKRLEIIRVDIEMTLRAQLASINTCVSFENILKHRSETMGNFSFTAYHAIYLSQTYPFQFDVKIKQKLSLACRCSRVVTRAKQDSGTLHDGLMGLITVGGQKTGHTTNLLEPSMVFSTLHVGCCTP